MAGDLIVALRKLPHRWIENSPSFSGTDGYGYSVTRKPDTFRLIQPNLTYEVEAAMDSVAWQGWEVRGHFLTESPNYRYVRGLIAQSRETIGTAQKVLGRTFAEREIAKNLGKLDELLGKTSTLLDRFHTAANHVEETRQITKPPSGPRMILVKALDDNFFRGNVDMRNLAPREEIALEHIAKCDRKVTQVYGATCVAEGELIIGKQASRIFHCLGAAVPVLACIYFGGDALRQLSQGNDPFQVGRKLFENVTLTFVGIGEGLLLQAMWS